MILCAAVFFGGLKDIVHYGEETFSQDFASFRLSFTQGILCDLIDSLSPVCPCTESGPGALSLLPELPLCPSRPSSPSVGPVKPTDW